MHHSWNDVSWGLGETRNTRGEVRLTIGSREFALIAYRFAGGEFLTLASANGTDDAFDNWGRGELLDVSIGNLPGQWLDNDASVALEAMELYVASMGLGGEWRRSEESEVAA